MGEGRGGGLAQRKKHRPRRGTTAERGASGRCNRMARGLRGAQAGGQRRLERGTGAKELRARQRGATVGSGQKESRPVGVQKEEGGRGGRGSEDRGRRDSATTITDARAALGLRPDRWVPDETRHQPKMDKVKGHASRHIDHSVPPTRVGFFARGKVGHISPRIPVCEGRACSGSCLHFARRHGGHRSHRTTLPMNPDNLAPPVAQSAPPAHLLCHKPRRQEPPPHGTVAPYPPAAPLHTWAARPCRCGVHRIYSKRGGTGVWRRLPILSMSHPFRLTTPKADVDGGGGNHHHIH